MKNKPLSFQLWLMISLLLLGVSVMIFGIMNVSVKNFFERQTFDTIEFSQTKKLQNTERLKGEDFSDALDSINADTTTNVQEYERSVRHVFLPKKRLFVAENRPTKDLPFPKKIRETILLQEETTKQYIFKSDLKIYAVVTKVQINNADFFIISFMHETYTKELIKEMNRNIFFVLVIALFLSSIIAKFIASRITRPLKFLEQQFAQIAHKKWQDDLTLNRNDEIGRLAASANLMQETLKEKDEEEKHFIQTVSHDVKTPIMVIRSYAQAVLDDVIPKEDISSSIQLIDNEAHKMHDKIQDMLYLYTLRNQPAAYEGYEQVNSLDYFNALLQRFQYTVNDITFNTSFEETTFSINTKTFTIAIENILENALRFAKTTIELTFKTTPTTYELKIFNDGQSIENPKNIFLRYKTEAKGNTGLGMAITKEIIETHHGTIRAINEKNGVAFIIELPKLV